MEMEEIDQNRFLEAREKAEEEYKKIERVYCPYFKEDVVFNAKGIEHIKFKNIRQARSHRDQYIRLRLISLAPKILRASHTCQGFSRRKVFEREKTNSRWEEVMRSVTYYEFVSVVNEVRVRIIVKQVEDGQKYFWSIIPFWKSDPTNNVRKVHSGKPETD